MVTCGLPHVLSAQVMPEAETAPDAVQADGGAIAGALRISPLSLAIDSDFRGASMQLTNPTAQPMGVQVRLFRWSQGPAGEARYEPTDEILASPSIARLAPGATQVIHILRASEDPAASPGPYRVVIDQIPLSADRPKVGAVARIRISLPLFMNSDRLAAPQITGSIEDGRLILSNSGERPAKIIGLSLQRTDGLEPLAIALGRGRYVLAGSRVAYTLENLPRCADDTPHRVLGEIEGQAAQVMIDVPCS